MISLPETYLNRMKELLQDDFEAYLASFEKPPVFSLRVNTGKISVADFEKISPFRLKKIPWTEDGFYYESDERPSLHPYYHAGLYYLQEASAMLPAEVLPLEEGDTVFDGCAAPGGKSSKLANKLKGSGVLLANDLSISRAQVLLSTLERQGVRNAYVMAEDILKLSDFENTFDKILIDAPCSGEGMFHKDSDLIRSWKDTSNAEYAAIQKQIMAAALKMLKTGGMMVYSTCTFSPQEDEEVIEYALEIEPSLKVLPIGEYPGFEHGITGKTKNCVRLYPHKLAGEGHFVALLQKGEKDDKTIRKAVNEKISFQDFNITYPDGNIVQRKERLYLEPKHDLKLDGLRILRSGLYLGEMKHERFMPSQALAMALKKAEYQRIISFNLDDIRVGKYLRCETLNVSDQDIEGLCLVCVDSFPLGFGKVTNGILKNYYPANYRLK